MFFVFVLSCFFFLRFLLVFVLVLLFLVLLALRVCLFVSSFFFWPGLLVTLPSTLLSRLYHSLSTRPRLFTGHRGERDVKISIREKVTKTLRHTEQRVACESDPGSEPALDAGVKNLY